MGSSGIHGGYDRDQLVHVPNCLFVSNVRLLSSEGSRVHPSGLLHFGHYFQMRSRHCHLPDLLRQVWQEGSLAMIMCMRWRAWLDFASFSSRTDTFDSIVDVVPLVRTAASYE